MNARRLRAQKRSTYENRVLVADVDSIEAANSLGYNEWAFKASRILSAGAMESRR